MFRILNSQFYYFYIHLWILMLVRVWAEIMTVSSRVNSPTLWGHVWLFVLRGLNIFRQQAQNASDVWTQYVQWEHLLAKYQLVSAICCHEHMSARSGGGGGKICRLPAPEGTDPSGVSDSRSIIRELLWHFLQTGSETTGNKSHNSQKIRQQEGWATVNGFSVEGLL